MYPLNPPHGNIDVADQQYQNNFHNYNLVKNMNSALKKIAVAAINDQYSKGEKHLVMGYATKYFVELGDWIYVRYSQMNPRDLMNNQK